MAIALVIALGTGTYAALMSTGAWRTKSNDASFALLHVHDLRVSLGQGTTATEGTLLRLVGEIPYAGQVSAIRERLLVPTQIAGPNDLLVPGEVVGTATGPGAIGVDDVSISAGTRPEPGTAAVIVEQAFASKNRLPAQGQLTLSGGKTVHYTSRGQSPEYFLVSSGQGALPFLSQKQYGVLFTTLHTAQRLAGTSGRVNDVVLTLRPGADRDVIAAQLTAAIDSARPALSATVTDRRDIDAYRVLYDDIDSDAQLWRIIGLLILAGAAFAALNLTTRIVQAQRREIGVGMALGLPPRRLAIRPLLFGTQVALLGVGLGVLVGVLVDMALRSVFVGLLPLPVWQTPFQLGVFAQAAAIGFGLPFLAVAWPVWRAVRVEPVDAIRVSHLAAQPRLSPALHRIPLPGRGWHHIPLRNLLRTPRRSALTALGIAAAITTMVTTVGFLDTFNATLDRTQAELLHAAPDRVTVALADIQPESGRVVAAIRALPQVASAAPGLMLTATATTPGHTVDLLTETLTAATTADNWSPSIVDGSPHGGIVLATKAAHDLHVGVGSTITLEHPQADASGTLRTATSTVRVAGLHPNPMRVLAYLDATTAAHLYGLTGRTNILTVIPAPGTTTNAVRHALLAITDVASAEAVRTTTSGMRSSLQEYLGILRVGAAITLLLALLIAFNTASIATDERARDHATMLAFGLPTRSVLTLTTIESTLIGTAGTLLGIAGGYGVLTWMTATTIPTVLPEISVTATLATGTVLTALLLGIGTVALAPLLTAGRLTRLDIPATLRVVE